ncbi:TPA: DUF1402 family protein [Candidatus Micrarchaeota archaeon]|nr:DUF1402 family protein [Candidatus Micrarchaeota archaeon]
MSESIVVNITLSKEAVTYLDNEAKKTYLSRATVAKQLLLQHIDELKVINARRLGYSIRKISEMYGIDYAKIIGILHTTQVDAGDKEADAYVEGTMKKLSEKG